MQAPRNYDEWGTREYTDVVRRLAIKYGVPFGEIEDFVSKVVFDFVAKDYLKIYDPNDKPFSSFLIACVHRRALGYIENYWLKVVRSRSLDAPLPSSEDEANAQTLHEVVPSPEIKLDEKEAFSI